MKTGTFRFAKTNGFRKVEQLREQHETDRKFLSRLKKVKSEVTRQQMMTGTNSSWMQGGVVHTASSTASHFRAKESVEHLPAVEQAKDRVSSRVQPSLSSFRRRPRDFEVWFDESKAKPLKVAHRGKNLYKYQIKVKPSQAVTGSSGMVSADEGSSADRGPSGLAAGSSRKKPIAGVKVGFGLRNEDVEGKVEQKGFGEGPPVVEEDGDDDESREISYQLKHRTRYTLTVRSAKVPIELGDTCIWQELTDRNDEDTHILVLEMSQHHGELKKKVRVVLGTHFEYFGKGMELKIWLVDKLSGSLHLCSKPTFEARNPSNRTRSDPKHHGHS